MLGVKAGPVIASGRPVHGIAVVVGGLLVVVGLLAAFLVISTGRLTVWLARRTGRAAATLVAGPAPADRMAAQVQVLRDLEALDPSDRDERIRLLRVLASHEDTAAAAADNDAESLAARWSAWLIRAIAHTETGVCPVRPDDWAYQHLREAADAGSLNDRAYACVRLHTAAATGLGERATTLLLSLARIYFQLAGHPRAEAARLAGTNTVGDQP